MFLGCGHKGIPFYKTEPQGNTTELFPLHTEEIYNVPLIDDGTLEEGELRIRGANGTRL